MLLHFITANRDKLVASVRARASKRAAPKQNDEELSGVPVFLDQLAETLRCSPSSTGNLPANDELSSSQLDAIERTASAHGATLLALGYTVGQVVHDYGEICQMITELADATHVEITTSEFRTLNLCLDRAMAQAVTEHARLRQRSMADGEIERLGVFAHELRNRISAAQLAFMAIKSGRAPVAGSVAAVVARNLQAMTALINRALVEVRLDAGNAKSERIHLAELIEDAEVDASMEAGVRGVSFSVAPTERWVDVDADPQILAGAVANILQNAFKFTRPGGHVSLRTSVVLPSRVQIAIEDECGGLPPGKAEELFGAFQQRGTNRSGLGLGLFISRKGVEASGGVLRVRDLPGSGCVFTIDLPLLPVTA